MTDILQMARVCKGTMHSEEISKLYGETIKTVKQVDAINQHTGSAMAKAKVNTDLSQKADLQGQAIVSIVAVAIHLNDVRPLVRSATTVIKEAIFCSTAGLSNVDALPLNQNIIMQGYS